MIQKVSFRGGTAHLRSVSDEPHSTIQRVAHRRGSQSVDNRCTSHASITPTSDAYETWTAARAAISAKRRKESKRQSNNSIHSVSALRHLCSKCQVFPLEECINSPKPGRVWSSPLKRLIWHRNDCPLCSLLIRSLCEPRNDPFKHAEISKYLPDEHNMRNMENWLMAISEDDQWMNTAIDWDQLNDWPFGLRISTSDEPVGDLSVQETAALGYSATERLQNADNADDQRAPEIRVMITLPCYVTISNNPFAAGLLDVQLWGYGRGQNARITALTSFRLRIESRHAIVAYAKTSSALTYGRVLDPGQIDLSVGRMWLDHCEQYHGCSCSKQVWPFRLGKPDFFRLLDVEDLSIIEVTDAQAWSYRYLTLSYVRGDIETFKLLQNNRHKLMRPHGLLKHFRNDLPKTLRDAINVTRGFEERYLWVDSLCIEQDNDLDRRKQLGLMDRIFGNALLTIIAVDGQDANAGLSGVERGSRHIRQISEEIQPDIRVMLPLPQIESVESSPWAQRAWTFQERLFSRRLVYFTANQIHWQCHRCIASEDMTSAEAGYKAEISSWLTIKPQHMGIKTPKDGYVDCSLRKLHDGTTHIMRSATFMEYAKLVQHYSKRQVSRDNDVLDAIAGLLHTFELCFKRPIRHGLPQALLDAAILWRPAERLERRDCSVPSWSWAGWRGEVKYASAFQVEVKEDWSLQRVASSTGQEWFRPLLRWYIWRDHELQLLNGNGFGVPIEATSRQLPEEWEKFPPLMSKATSKANHLGRWDNIMDDIESLVLDPTMLAESRLQLGVTDFPPAVLPLLGPQHLIFRTSCSKALHYGRISRSAVLDPKVPLKYPLISTTSKEEVGSIRLDGNGPRGYDPTMQEFIVISEALYLDISQPMPQDGKNSDFPLYNVMLIEWTHKGLLANRLGLGRVLKDAWKALDPPPVAKTVVLE